MFRIEYGIQALAIRRLKLACDLKSLQHTYCLHCNRVNPSYPLLIEYDIQQVFSDTDYINLAFLASHTLRDDQQCLVCLTLRNSQRISAEFQLFCIDCLSTFLLQLLVKIQVRILVYKMGRTAAGTRREWQQCFRAGVGQVKKLPAIGRDWNSKTLVDMLENYRKRSADVTLSTNVFWTDRCCGHFVWHVRLSLLCAGWCCRYVKNEFIG